MKNNKKSLIVLCVLLLVNGLIPVSSSASFPCTVRGYVFANDELCVPEEIVLSFSYQDIDADIYPDGYFIFDFEANAGDVGIFNVVYGGETYLADETITIQNSVYSYKINLSITVGEPPVNNPPNIPVNPVPANNSENISLNPTLSVFVTDPDGDDLLVSFYNASNHQLIDSITVDNASTAEVLYSSLGYNTIYHWYAVANDSQYETKSEEFVFKTAAYEPPEKNLAPNKPINPIPQNNSEDISLNPTLSVYVTDPNNNDLLRVSFYDASNDELIGTSSGVENATRAGVTWHDLDFNTIYSWYVVVNDSEYETYSDVFTFKTAEEDNIPPYVYFEKPEVGSLYLFGNKVFAGILKTPFIIGKLNIVVNAVDNQTISRVELSIKGRWREITQNLTDTPYTYEWNKFCFGKYNITATAYDINNNFATASITVYKIF